MTVKEQAARDTILESICRAIIRGVDVIVPPRKMTRELKRAIRHALKAEYLVECVIDDRCAYRVTKTSKAVHQMIIVCVAMGAAGLDDDGQKLVLTPKTRRIICNLLDENPEARDEYCNEVWASCLVGGGS